MGYLPKVMLLTRTFREGRDPFPGIARPPDHRITSDRFSPPRKTLLLHDIICYQFPFSKISRTTEKHTFRANSLVSHRYQSFPPACMPHSHSGVLPFDAECDFRHFNPFIENKKHFPIGIKFTRHREPSQIEHL